MNEHEAVRSAGGGTRASRGRAGATVGVAALTAIALSVAVTDASAGIEGYRFTILGASGLPGRRVSLPVEGAHERSAQGFSLGITYPSEIFTIERVHLEDTILEAIETDFFEVTVNPEEGFLTLGCLVDARPPITGNVIPNIGEPMTFFFIEGTVSEDAEEGEMPVDFTDGLGAPPVRNLYVIEGFPQIPTELRSGRLEVIFTPFIRGDADLDREINITDAIVILDYLFRGGRPLLCRDAADTNDDEALDMSDAIYLLSALFRGGPPPPPPWPDPGLDPSGDFLDCATPLVLDPSER